MKKKKVLLVLHQVGPYHNDRFTTLQESVDLTVLEILPDSNEYSWNTEFARVYNRVKLPNNEQQLFINNILNSTDFDLVINCGWSHKYYHLICLTAARRNILSAVISDSRYEDEPRVFYKELVKKILLKSYDAALVAGSQSKSYLIKLGFPKEKIFQPWDVIDNKSMLKSFEHDIQYSERYFICVARLIEKKNIFGLLKAYQQYILNGGSRKLKILGDGSLENAVLDKIDQLNLTNEVSLEGFVQQKNIRKYYQQSFALILPSFYDQWGLVVNEAMASGLPIIATENCGAAVEFSEKGSLFLVNPNEIDSITNAMLNLEKLSVENWVKLGVINFNLINVEFTLRDFCLAVENILKVDYGKKNILAQYFLKLLLLK